MFYHAYNAYMVSELTFCISESHKNVKIDNVIIFKDNAYPADELMPLSCKGRYRGSERDRGDIDSTLGK